MKLLNRFLENLKNSGLNINTVYDIGACKGVWSSSIKNTTLYDSEFILFEANPVYKTILEQTGFKFFNTVLSNPGRTSVKFYNGSDTGDSYYKESTKWYDSKSYVDLPCTTLDDIVLSNNLPKPDFIKIDTQGSELDILSGSSSVIQDVKLIYCECPIIQYNLGSPNIQDYLEFFKKINFVPVAVLEHHYLENILVQIDIMFMNFDTKNNFLSPTENIRPFIS
jgi:FkbM family methyltransferase